MILAPATDDTATIQVDCQMATRRLAAPQGRVAASPLGAVGAKPIREHVSECEANDQNDCNFQHWESRQHRSFGSYTHTRELRWNRTDPPLRQTIKRQGNPAGRLRGSRNKLSEEVICALLRDFREHGQKAIAKVRRTQPAAYLKVLALLVPREHKVEYSNSLKNWTDEELEAGIDLVKQMLESRAAASGAVIEGTAEPVGMLGPAELEQPQHKRSNRLLEHVDTAVAPKERKPRKRVPSPVDA